MSQFRALVEFECDDVSAALNAQAAEIRAAGQVLKGRVVGVRQEMPFPDLADRLRPAAQPDEVPTIMACDEFLKIEPDAI